MVISEFYRIITKVTNERVQNFSDTSNNINIPQVTENKTKKLLFRYTNVFVLYLFSNRRIKKLIENEYRYNLILLLDNYRAFNYFLLLFPLNSWPLNSRVYARQGKRRFLEEVEY